MKILSFLSSTLLQMPNYRKRRAGGGSGGPPKRSRMSPPPSPLLLPSPPSPLPLIPIDLSPISPDPLPELQLDEADWELVDEIIREEMPELPNTTTAEEDWDAEPQEAPPFYIPSPASPPVFLNPDEVAVYNASDSAWDSSFRCYHEDCHAHHLRMYCTNTFCSEPCFRVSILESL